MKKPLCDILFASEKRKQVLLLLQDGAKEMQFLLRSLHTTRQALLPQMKILEEHSLVARNKDTYELTTIGKLIVDQMLPLLNIISTFDIDIDYWGTRDLEFIPPHLYTRLHELGPSPVVASIPPMNVCEPSKQAVENAKVSTQQVSVTTFLFPVFPSVLEDLRKQGVKLQLIVSTELYAKIKEEQRGHVKDLLMSELNKVYLYPKKMGFVSFGYNDFSFTMRILNKEGYYDHKYITFNSPSALIWAKELFEYYLKDSIPITEI